MFAATATETALLILCLLGVAAALVGHSQGWTTTRQSLVALAAAFLLPVAGSLIAIAIVALAWHSTRRLAPTVHGRGQ